MECDAQNHQYFINRAAVQMEKKKELFSLNYFKVGN